MTLIALGLGPLASLQSAFPNTKTEIQNPLHPSSFALGSDTGMVYKLQGFPKCFVKMLEDGFGKKNVFRI